MRQPGKRPLQHYFFLNPYEDVRFTRCPKCGGKTRLRKFVLVIHVEPRDPLALRKTCRYCVACDLIIAHRDELEAQLYLVFSKQAPQSVGNDYLVLGTLEPALWQQGRQQPLNMADVLDQMYLFKDELHFEPANYGWAKD
jgi:hypothetical protein